MERVTSGMSGANGRPLIDGVAFSEGAKREQLEAGEEAA